jgi:phenylalanyl-tRNA synthetase beta chain
MANDQVLGYCGEVHPKTVLAYDLELGEAPMLFEIDLENVFSALLGIASFQKETVRFPPVTRDLALVVSQQLTHQEIQSSIEAFPKRKSLDSVRLFDVYTGANLPQDTKSMAYSLSFRSKERTLKDEEVDQEITGLIAWLKTSIGAQLR